VFDLYNSLKNKDHYYISRSSDALTTVDRNINTFVDFENKKCYFSTPEFIEFIAAAKDATDPQKIADGEFGYTSGVGGYDEAYQNELALKYLFYDDSISVEAYVWPDYEKKKFTTHIPLTRANGSLIAEPLAAFLMSKASNNKELAWEFIKYCTTAEGPGYIQYAFPVHRQLFEAYVNANWQSSLGRLRRSLGEVEPGETREQIMERLVAYNEMPMEFRIYLDLDWIKEIMQSFYNGIMTAEQVASELQNKVSLYLME
jgi:ABC-type glycerol-3-phosphate transport system substrate-binding protein